MKLGKHYLLSIEADDGEFVIIEDPITIDFHVKRSTMSSLNSMQLTIYGLAEKTRSRIYQDKFTLKTKKKVILQVGYESLSTIFIGSIFFSNSSRRGTNVVHYIEAWDGAYDTSITKTFRTIAAGTTKRDLIKSLIGDFPTLKEGTLGSIDGSLRRGAVIDDSTFEVIKEYTDDKVFIEFETVNVLADSEIIGGEVFLFNAKTGLLGTPRRSDSLLKIDTLLEPRVKMGQVVAIESVIQPQYNGQYKVIGCTHSGTISGSSGATAQSSFELLIGNKLFGKFDEV